MKELSRRDFLRWSALGGAGAVFGDDGKVGAEGFGEGVGHFDAADIGRDHHNLVIPESDFADVFQNDRGCVEVIHRDIEKTLNGRIVYINKNNP